MAPHVQVVGPLVIFLLLTLPANSWASTAGSVLINVGETRGEFWSGGKPQLGLDLACGPHLLPLRLAAYAAASYSSDPCNIEECDQVNYTIGEAGVGAQAVWNTRIAHVSLGAGPAWGRYHLEEEGGEYSGTTHYDYRGMGWWTGGDILIRAWTSIGLGGGARYSRIEFHPDNFKEFGFQQYAWSFHGSIGWLWPGGE